MSNTRTYPRFSRCVVLQPSKFSSVRSSSSGAPNKTLVPEYVYGYSGKGTKGNIIHMNSEGHLVYPSAACGIVWDCDHNTQVVFNQHDDDVVCVGLHPDRVLAATGQVGKDDMINVWDTRTGELVSRLDTRVHFQAGGVLALCFSNDGTKIAAVGGNPLDSILLIYNWQDGSLLGKTKCHSEAIYFLTFTPNDGQVVMCGKDVIKFFTMEARGVTVRQGVFYPRGTTQTLYSCTFDKSGNVLCGTKDGSIYIFSGNKLTQKHTAHQGALYSIYSLPSGEGFVTAGNDGCLKLWVYTGATTEGVSEFQLAKEMNLGSSIRSVCPDMRDDGAFYAMKFNGDMVRVDVNTNNTAVIAKSHTGANAEVWGLCDIPGTSLFATGGDDSRVIIWNRSTRTFVLDLRVPKGKVRGLASNGSELVAATFEGTVYVYQLTSLLDNVSTLPIKELKDGREEIAAVQFSPDGEYLACGSHDNVIYIHNTQNYTLVSKLTGHSSFVKHIDFSADSQFLQSVCGAYELLYWSLEKMSQVKSTSEMRDVEWATQTCTLGWTVKGIWQPDMDGTDINAIDVDFRSNIIASADDKGLVRLLNYPAVSEPAGFIAARGHCSHVTNVKLVDNAKVVLSTGGYDLTIFQWRV